jgi:hypothetical protein
VELPSSALSRTFSAITSQEYLPRRSFSERASVVLLFSRLRFRPRIYCSTSLDATFMASPDARYIELCVPPDGLRRGTSSEARTTGRARRP